MRTPSPNDLLVVEDLDKAFTLHLHGGARLPVVSNVAFTVARGECVVLGGPSGVGKSSILKIVFGNYLAEGGHIWLADGGRFLDIARATPGEIVDARRRVLGYVSQFLRVVPRVPALDVVAEVLTARGTVTDIARRRAAELLLRLNIARRLHAIPPATFSGGEQQRVNLARGLIAEHPVLLLDEPTASLDAENRAVVVAMIREAKARGTAVVAICHDADVRDAIADRLFPLAPLQDAA